MASSGASTFLAVPGGNSFVQVCVIALSEVSFGQGTYLSTKHLQLASLQLCTVCRSVSTLHVTVDSNTPRRLWETSAEQASTHMTRVPVLKARGVTWIRSTDATFMYGENEVLANVDSVCFCPAFNRSLEHVVWPKRVRQIVFRGNKSYREDLGEFNQPIEGVLWPDSLQLSLIHI